MVPRQMLHQNKGQARIVFGHGGEESFERRQPPGRCADADDREFRAMLLGWLLDLLWIDCFVWRLRFARWFGHDLAPGPLVQTRIVFQSRAVQQT